MKYIHTPADLAQPTYSFYTVDKGSLLVKCDVVFQPAPPGSRYDGGLPAFKVKSRTITSVRPTWSRGSLLLGQVQLLPAPPGPAGPA